MNSCMNGSFLVRNQFFPPPLSRQHELIEYPPSVLNSSVKARDDVLTLSSLRVKDYLLLSRRQTVAMLFRDL